MSCYDHDMGNTVGSASADVWNVRTAEDAYIAGLWCADGYHRTSSIGLSNVNEGLITRFKDFFLGYFPPQRIKVRIYEPDAYKRWTRAYHLYVNSRPLLRKFQEIKKDPGKYIRHEHAIAYFAGRFDGDGSVAANFRNDCRIVYGNNAEAEQDAFLLQPHGFVRLKIYRYAKAKTFCLYISRFEAERFLSLIYPFSLKLQTSAFAPRRDLIATVA